MKTNLDRIAQLRAANQAVDELMFSGRITPEAASSLSMAIWKELSRDENAEHCLFCGAVIPEGRQVCPNCIDAITHAAEAAESAVSRRHVHRAVRRSLMPATYISRIVRIAINWIAYKGLFWAAIIVALFGVAFTFCGVIATGRAEIFAWLAWFFFVIVVAVKAGRLN